MVLEIEYEFSKIKMVKGKVSLININRSRKAHLLVALFRKEIRTDKVSHPVRPYTKLNYNQTLISKPV